MLEDACTVFVYSAAHAPATRGGQVRVTYSQAMRLVKGSGRAGVAFQGLTPCLAGDNCSTAACPKDCNGNGMCDTSTGRCICFPGFGGRACGTLLCAGLVCALLCPPRLLPPLACNSCIMLRSCNSEADMAGEHAAWAWRQATARQGKESALRANACATTAGRARSAMTTHARMSAFLRSGTANATG